MITDSFKKLIKQKQKEVDKFSKAEPQWLKNIQNNSWEPEILISGAIIIFLFSVNEYINSFDQWTSFSLANPMLDIILLWLPAGINIIKTCFISHLLLRGVWVAFVGLSYSYPKGVQKSKFKFKWRYRRFVEKENLPIDSVIYLERICSTIYAFSFLMLLIVLGSILTLSLSLIFLTVNDGSLSGFSAIVLMFFLLTLLLYLIDSILFGVFRRNKIIGMLYYPIYIFYHHITLARFYRNILYTFLANNSKWKIISLICFLIFIGVLDINLDSSSFSGTRKYEPFGANQKIVYTDYEEHLTAESMIGKAVIPSEIINSKFLKVFIPYYKSYDHFFKNINSINLDSIKKVDPDNYNEHVLSCFSSNWKFKIDTFPMFDYHVFFYTHHITKQEGFIYYIDISSLPPGNHVINTAAREEIFKTSNIMLSNIIEEKPPKFKEGWKIINFWKE